MEKLVLIIKVERSSAGLAMKDMRNGNGVTTGDAFQMTDKMDVPFGTMGKGEDG